MVHIPVLLDRVVELLELKPGMNVLDCTVDGGGYAEAVLEQTGPEGEYVGIDADPSMLGISRQRLERFGRRVYLKELNFRHLRIAATDFGKPIHGIVADLGLSSLQLEDGTRGFSFMRPGPLDMRLSPKTSLTAATIVNQWTEPELRRILLDYGEERAAGRIARGIIEHRRKQRILTTDVLAEVIERFLPRRGKLHPATRTFQALRIATNDELGALEEALPQMLESIAPGGRIAIIAYHSLEDRIIKNFFRMHAKQGTFALINKKPLVPMRAEILNNPRARSAKLRVAARTRL